MDRKGKPAEAGAEDSAGRSGEVLSRQTSDIGQGYFRQPIDLRR